MIDYSKYSDLESYLFNEVASNFQNRGYLTTEEFFCIIIWKANRAKSKIARKFNDYKDINKGIINLTSTIYNKDSNKEKMRVLIEKGYYLPMASAILSVLYPNDFYIYDFRVCDILKEEYKTDKYHRVKNWIFERLWNGYEEYLQKTLDVSRKDNYRSADKYLWGKSFSQQLEKDIKNRFGEKTNTI